MSGTPRVDTGDSHTCTIMYFKSHTQTTLCFYSHMYAIVFFHIESHTHRGGKIHYKYFQNRGSLLDILPMCEYKNFLFFIRHKVGMCQY